MEKSEEIRKQLKGIAENYSLLHTVDNLEGEKLEIFRERKTFGIRCTKLDAYNF